MSSPAKTSTDTAKLLTEAVRVQAHAHAPYSKFRVGAALVDEHGTIYAGCNVENSSYGGTVCAERNAIGAMVAGGGKHLAEIVVVTDLEKGTPPCGICRQILAEFASDPTTVKIHLANRKGIQKSFTLAQLLPEAFDGTFLT
jgi:cytidine deaminase